MTALGEGSSERPTDKACGLRCPQSDRLLNRLKKPTGSEAQPPSFGGLSMDTLMWRDEYSVGYSLIDEQHKELFRRINSFGEALWDGQGKELLAAHLRYLADYVVSHFQTEEGLMKDHQFPHYATHKPVHDAFVQEVSHVLGAIADGRLDTATAISVFERSCTWTRDHVRGMDQELGRFLAAHHGLSGTGKE